MNFVKLSLQNFKSFAGAHVIDFTPIVPGICFITGNNYDNPNLGANGCGKSTLLDAICFCLYGKTTRGLRASDTRSWGIDETVLVSLICEIDGTEYEIQRTWSPVSLKLREGDDDFKLIQQTDLDRLLRISMDAFLHSVLISQFSTLFFDLTASQKLSLFSSLLDLDRWAKRAEKAAESARQRQELVHSLRIKQAKAEQSIQHYESLIKQEQQLADTFEETRNTKMQNIITRLHGIEQEIIDIEQTAKDCSAHKFEEKIEKLKKIKQQSQKKLSSLHTDYKALDNAIHAIRTKLRDLTSTKNRISRLEGECVTCLQPISKDHVDAQTSIIDKEIKQHKDEMSSYEEVLNEIQEEIGSLTDEINQTDQQIEALRAKVQKLRITKAKQLQQIEALYKEQERLTKEQQELEQQSNVHKDRIKHLQNDLRNAKNTLKQLTAQIDQAQKEHDVYSYWTKGFKQLRLDIVNDYLNWFQIETNNILHSLGLNDWEVKYQIEKEKKTGGVSKGFHVLISTPQTDGKHIPWEAWSGGESQRLRLAAAMALSDIIKSVTDFQSNIEFYDEPTRHLSESGIQDLIATLRDRALQSNKQIWLIDHNTISFGDFVRVLHIEKFEGSSSIRDMA